MIDLPRRLVAEFVGTGFLLVAVVGSGIVAETLTTDGALALLCNAIATGAALIVLITVLGPISGAHFNPAVTLVIVLRRELRTIEALAYVGVQVAGAIAGTILAHAMFGLPLLAVSSHVRTGGGQWLAESLAAFGLVLVIIGGLRARKDAVPWLVGLYIVAAYWFTSSTSFANPAVTIARAFTDTFSGIRPIDTPAFIVAQMAGAVVAFGFARWLWLQAEPGE